MAPEPKLALYTVGLEGAATAAVPSVAVVWKSQPANRVCARPTAALDKSASNRAVRTRNAGHNRILGERMGKRLANRVRERIGAARKIDESCYLACYCGWFVDSTAGPYPDL